MRARQIAVGVLIVALFAIPVFTRDPYYLHVLIAAGIQAILAVGLWMLLTAGNITVAQASFLGIGSYMSVLLVVRLGWSFWAAFPVCGLVASAFALILGVPTLRLRGVYFVMVTVGFGMILNTVWTRYWWVFGFHTGVIDIPPPGSVSLFGLYTIQFGSQYRVSFYYLTLLFALVMLLIMYRMTHSRVGLTFNAIRSADDLSASVGINLSRYRIIAFTATCFFAGAAGSLYAHYTTFISNQSFAFQQSANVLMATVIGGTGAFAGPILGVGFMSVLSEVLRPLQEYIPLVQGATLILVLVFMPRGIFGAVETGSAWVKQRFSAPAKEALPGEQGRV